VPGRRGRVTTVATLDDASGAALAALAGADWVPRPFSLPREEIGRRVEAARHGLGGGAGSVRGVYAGGTLAHEAVLILEPLLGPVGSNLGGGAAGRHRVVDLGADEYTRGHAHPMIDPTARIRAIAEAALEPDLAVLLVDVVLGHGAAPDPAGDIAPALEAARAEVRSRGRELAVVATVVGTDADPQGRAGQVARLERAGAWVLPSNAEAARAAACIAGGAAVVDALAAEARR
jgi:FdrA protein